jgi:protein involved in polysaccharide export with SLBB domain
MDILQQRPEVVVELRQFAADQLQQQGVPTQADSISDQMLYGQIASNPQLRSSITVWLRARGYISDADLHRSLGTGSFAEDSDGLLSSPDGLDAMTQLPLADPSNLSASQSLTGINARSTQQSDTASSRFPGSASTQARDRDAGQRRQKNITDEPDVLRLPTPYNLLSLRDLYTQVPQDDAKLKRFGSDVFLNRDSASNGRTGLGPRDIPIDLPIGPDYILGSGDGLTISLSGGVSQTFTRGVDREGKIILPEAGPMVIAGLTLQRAQAAIAAALTPQYHNVRVDVAIARLRTVRVYVVGDVQRPGAYDLSSLSTPLNALYAAGGPTSVGSLRIVRHLRGKQLVREVDLYDFLLHGVRMDDERLQSGDTLLIPPAGPQVAVAGMVKRPAIYELKGAASLSEVLADAGGATVAAALNQITVNRIRDNQQRETVSLNLSQSATADDVAKAMQAFSVKDGDRVHVSAILPYSESSIYLQGHVVRPGKQAYHEGMQLSDVVRSYQDLLPEPATKGEIVRLVPPDLHPETMQFDVADTLIGNSRIALQPFDTVRIFGRYEFDSPQVTIRGEVQRPGSYALSGGMTAAQLVRMAGGFKRDALLESADLTSYTVQEKKRIVSQRASISIGAAVNAGVNSGADVPLKPGDVLTIHQISGWGDIGASISLEGEVTYPGSYGLQAGERLSSVLRRSGGFRDSAYPRGAILVRTQVRELEEKSRAELIRQIESNAASARLAPSLSSQDQSASVQAAQQQQAEVLQRLKSQPASGRLVIHISGDIDSWANTDADIEMRSGDVLTVPKRPGFVLVSGEVYNPSAITFVPGKNAGWYLRRAGGNNDVANRKEIFVIRANGSVVGRRSGEWYDSNVLSTRLEPGDVVVVPQRIIGGSLFWRNLLTVAQLSSSIAITAAVAGII